MIIPIAELEPTTLTAIIEQFVLSEGTDYGETVYSLEQKVAHVRSQLENESAFLVYSELHQTINIISRHEYANRNDSG